MQVHVLFMVLLCGKAGPSLSHSLRQVVYLDPTERLTMGGKRSSAAVHEVVYVVDEALVQMGISIQPL